jgi:diguanylate cyclase (GGDEF)-like protein
VSEGLSPGGEGNAFRSRWPALSKLSLRPKLVVAFGAIALLAGLCGAAGLFFVSRSTATVTLFTDVTAPLLTESVGLVESAQRTRSTFLDAIAKGEDARQLSRNLSDARSDTQAQITKLRSLSRQAGIDIPLDTIEGHERAFFETLSAMSAASERERSATAAARGALARYEAAYDKVRPTLNTLADRADGEVMKGEDEAKVQVQTRTTTVDRLGDVISRILNGPYPVVQIVNRLSRELEQVDDAARRLSAPSSVQQSGQVEQNLRRSFRIINSLTKRLNSRLYALQGQADIASLQRGFAEIEASTLGANGLLQSQRAAAGARSDIAGGQLSLDQVERAYFATLNDVEAAVRNLNESAKNRTTAGVVRAQTITLIGVLFTIASGLLFSMFFGRRLTAPLIRLTEQVKHVRASRELKALPDASVANRGDEIGTLSRSFNLMIMELAAARQQLIEASEAEINRQYERLSLAINSMPQGLCMFDANRNLIVCNRRYAEIYGLRSDQTMPGTGLEALLRAGEAANVDSEYTRYFIKERLAVIARGQPWQYVYELHDGRAIAVSHLPLPSGGSIATHEDITERRKAEAQIAYMAHHDMLTKLPNRVRFREELQQVIEGNRDNPLAVLCLDLDYFKNVNDTLGHPVGDALLKAVAERLRSCVRPTDKVARLGGDEFAIVQFGVEQPAGSTALAARLIKELGEPFTVDGHQVVIGASVGVSLFPDDGREPDLLLKNADMALYRAKEDGRGAYRFFEPAMDARMQARRTLELDLRKALVLGEFELYYQPLVKLDTGAVSACEALLRWHHPERGLVQPSEFIPLAEEIGLINQIGAWALKQACTEAKRWPDDIKVAVNLSPVQFKRGTLVLDVMAALGASGLPARRLELEITETVLLAETESTLAILNDLRKLGVRISMDDFGTGYSSLGYLRKFPFDKIKIDQSFISNLADNRNSIAIIRAVTGLGNALGITTTAEGVETQAQLEQIKSEGCTEAQGYLFSEPRTAAELERFLEQPLRGVEAVA